MQDDGRYVSLLAQLASQPPLSPFLFAILRRTEQKSRITDRTTLSKVKHEFFGLHHHGCKQGLSDCCLDDRVEEKRRDKDDKSQNDIIISSQIESSWIENRVIFRVPAHHMDA